MVKLKNNRSVHKSVSTFKPSSVRRSNVRRSTPRRTKTKKITRTRSRRPTNVKSSLKRNVPRRARAKVKTSKNLRPRKTKRANVKKSNVRRSTPKRSKAKSASRIRSRRPAKARTRIKKNAPRVKRTKSTQKARPRKTKRANVRKSNVGNTAFNNNPPPRNPRGGFEAHPLSVTNNKEFGSVNLLPSPYVNINGTWLRFVPKTDPVGKAFTVPNLNVTPKDRFNSKTMTREEFKAYDRATRVARNYPDFKFVPKDENISEKNISFAYTCFASASSHDDGQQHRPDQCPGSLHPVSG